MSRTFCSYRKKAQGCLFISSAMSKYSEKLTSMSNWSLPGNFSAGAFIFKFTVYRNVRNQFVLSIRYLLCVILTWQSKWTKVLGISLGTSKKNTYLISNLWIPKPKNSYQKENTGNGRFWLTKIFQVWKDISCINNILSSIH